jgi:hypothetical protein
MLALMKVLQAGVHSVDKGIPYTAIPKLIDAGINHSIQFMEKSPTDNTLTENENTIDCFEALEGADLRQLSTFLDTHDEGKRLGNLYRITTDDGHVKWVCIDHFRSTYREQDQKSFEEVVGLNGGKYDTQLGKVTIKLESRIRAEEFFKSLSKARRVFELDIDLDWGFTNTDLESLEKALRQSSVSTLYLDARRIHLNIARQLVTPSTHYEIIIKIMRSPNMKSIHLYLNREFSRLSNLKSKTPYNLHELSVKLFSLDGKPNNNHKLDYLETFPLLTTLTLNGYSIHQSGIVTLSKALQRNRTLTSLDMSRIFIGYKGILELSKGLRINTTLATLNLYDGPIRSRGIEILLETLEINKSLVINLKSKLSWDYRVAFLSRTLISNTYSTKSNQRLKFFTEDGVKTLLEIDNTNFTFTSTTLDLSGYSIGKEGAAALSEVLKINSTLTDLNLNNSWIGKEGIVALSEALKINSTLTNLNLKSNSIEKERAAAWAGAHERE